MPLMKKSKKLESETEFLRRIIRLAATRASMASWGQPFEAIASWMLLSKTNIKGPNSSKR